MPNKLPVRPRLDLYDNAWYRPGRGPLVRTLWYFCNALFFICPLCPVSAVRVWLLRLFGARVGRGVVVKPGVNIKYPWRLSIGDHCWIGERVWIDCLGRVEIGHDACVSQGAMLLCGNHNYKRETFDLIVGDIRIGAGAWIGAKAVVCPGVEVGEGAVLGVGSVAAHNLAANTVYMGSPAREVRKRINENDA